MMRRRRSVNLALKLKTSPASIVFPSGIFVRILYLAHDSAVSYTHLTLPTIYSV